MNTTNPNDLFYESVECRDEFISATDFEISQIYDSIYGDD